MKSVGDISPWRCLGNSHAEMASGQLHPWAWSLGLKSVLEVVVVGVTHTWTGVHDCTITSTDETEDLGKQH